MNRPLILIGASLGGLDALSRLFAELPAELPAAVAVVQHRGSEGDTGLAHILQRYSKLPVQEAQDKDPIEAGRIYLAPANYHLLVDDDRFALDVDEAVNWARPSIDVLFESACHTIGRDLVAVLLTASNQDGARGIEAIANAGGLTIVQDPKEAESDVAPLAALKRTRVSHVLRLHEMADCLVAHLRDIPSITRFSGHG